MSEGKNRISEDEQKIDSNAWWRIMQSIESYQPTTGVHHAPPTNYHHIDGDTLKSLRVNFPKDSDLSNRKILFENCMKYVVNKAADGYSCEYLIPQILPGGTRIRDFYKVANELCQDLNSKPGIRAHLIPNSMKVYISWE